MKNSFTLENLQYYLKIFLDYGKIDTLHLFRTFNLWNPSLLSRPITEGGIKKYIEALGENFTISDEVIKRFINTIIPITAKFQSEEYNFWERYTVDIRKRIRAYEIEISRLEKLNKDYKITVGDLWDKEQVRKAEKESKQWGEIQEKIKYLENHKKELEKKL